MNDTKKKSEAKLLKEKLLTDNKNAGLVLDKDDIRKANEFCEGYKKFLDMGKTEREAVSYAVKLAKDRGFKPFVKGMAYTPGDKIYVVNRSKSVILAVIGREPVENGVKLIAAHVDSPRLDLKPCPLYEEAQIALFKTHYYGGIKKYQWAALPLALHGVLIKANGDKVEVCLGESPDDPVFCVSDLLPHLADEQMKRPLREGIKGEELNVIIGLMPFKDDDESEKVKLNIIKLLNEKYGIIEDDFVSAELELVPAEKARDVGFDKSMIGAYGQDDRVCAYTALQAVLDCVSPRVTTVAVLTDKEETGSGGNTGLNSSYLKYFIADIAKAYGVEGRDVLSNTKCLSADVNAAYDPTFPNVSEKKNSSYLNYGVVVTKYTGARGKAGTSDASAEFVGYVRKLFDDNKIVWQTGELGKVDMGGGGTVAVYLAELNMDVVDVGVPVLSMHSPFELTSKLDVYMAYRAFYEFFAEK